MHLTAPSSSFISIDDMSLDEILTLFIQAKSGIAGKPFAGKIMASLFFEPSTRTRLSFEAAFLRLGGQIIGFSDAKTSSAEKGESLSDTIKIVSAMCDLIVLRHPADGAARLAKQVSKVPVINAGDGAHEHPTQALVDLFTLWEAFPDLHNLEIGLGGDLRYSRTIFSLVKILKHFNPRFNLICAPELEPHSQTLDILKENRIKFAFYRSYDEVIDRLDVLYLTRRQKERSSVQSNALAFTKQSLSKVKPHLKILHPLPRNEELPLDIDDTPHALYFKQAENGIKIREALMYGVLSDNDLN
jgi:aspartate carbamoyltransferase catalytic subunit